MVSVETSSLISTHQSIVTIYLPWGSLDTILLKLNWNDDAVAFFFYSALDVREILQPPLTKRCKQSARE